MKEIEKRINMYVADDGKEFLDKTECEKYEETLKNIKFFVVNHAPDLNETGLFMTKDVVAVYSPRYGCEFSIVLNWCIKEKGYPVLCESVQGCGYQEGFDILQVDGNDYAKLMWRDFASGQKVNEHQTWTFPRFGDKVFLSPVEVEGFPKPFDFQTEWNLK